MMRGEQLLKKYVHKGLSPEEQFELEKLALEDDFLADAWEGLQGLSKESAKNALTRITNNLEGKKSTKIIPLYRKMWPYVAVASVVLIAALTIFNPQRDQMAPGQENIALNMDVEKEKISVASPESSEPELATNQVSQLEKAVDIPTATTQSDDVIPNALTEADLASLTEEEKPVDIPNSDPEATKGIAVLIQEKEWSEVQETSLKGEDVSDELQSRAGLRNLEKLC